MNDCQDLSDLQRHFDHRFESVHLSLAVRGGLYDDDMVEEISSEVLKLRKQVTDLSTELTKWKKQLQEYKVYFEKYCPLDATPCYVTRFCLFVYLVHVCKIGLWRFVRCSYICYLVTISENVTFDS